MADRIQEIRDYCSDYCRRHSATANGRMVVPIMFRMDFGGIIFGYYALTYNTNRAVSVLLRKASAHESELDVLRALEERRKTGVLESNRVVSDHVACWEAVETPSPAASETLIQLEAEARYFKREQAATRNLKPRIVQDIGRYNAIHYGNRALVPMIFQLGRAGIVFGFYNDCEGAQRGNAGHMMLTHASTFSGHDEIWQAISRGYNSKRRACVVLDYVTHYYSMMDMQELADNAKAKELIARIPPKPAPARPASAEGAPTEPPEGEGQEQDFLKLWGWQVPVAKDSLPGLFTQDFKMPGIAEGIGKALKTEIRIPFGTKKE